ncbi:MAG: hypothetical protein D6675_09395 [Gemmatimonadetes bacterium]|nr:MAG: hypothetical protein D6675_09395 [Gemmatimonadota bacterium]
MDETKVTVGAETAAEERPSHTLSDEKILKVMNDIVVKGIREIVENTERTGRPSSLTLKINAKWYVDKTNDQEEIIVEIVPSANLPKNVDKFAASLSNGELIVNPR